MPSWTRRVVMRANREEEAILARLRARMGSLAGVRDLSESDVLRAALLRLARDYLDEGLLPPPPPAGTAEPPPPRRPPGRPKGSGKMGGKR